MRIVKAEITNMAAFAKVAYDLPAIAIIAGKNGKGKSSLLDVIRYTFESGHDEDIIHGTEPWGECILTMSDGGAVKCRASREGETVRAYKKPGAKAFKVGRAEIDRIANAISYDPMSFLELPEKGTARQPGQLERLLEIMPINLEPGELDAALAHLPEKPDIPQGNAFDVIRSLSKTLFDTRTGLNTSVKTLNAHAEELEKAVVPMPADGTNWVEESAKLAALLKETESKLQSRKDAIADTFLQFKDDCRDDEHKAHESIDGEIDEQIRELERHREIRKQQATKERQELVEDALQQQAKAVEETQLKMGAVISDLNTRKGQADERARASEASGSTHAAIKVAKESAAAEAGRAQAITQALDKLAALKAELAKRIQIPDVEIVDGRICRDHDGAMIPLKRWNTQQKMFFCLKIGVLAHGEAGILIVDNCEHFDAENREALMAAAAHYAETEGLQFLFGIVSDDGATLSITDGKEVSNG